MLPISRRTSWTAPCIERAAAALLAASVPRTFERGVDFHLLQRESGSMRNDLPIWRPTPGVIGFGEAWGPVVKTEVPDVPGAFVLSNVLTAEECRQILALSQAMGYTEDAPVSLGRNIRRNENCVIIADDSMWQPIWERVAAFMPPRVAGGEPAGLNQRWRLYRYQQGDVFKLHTDGSWPGSGVDGKGRLLHDKYGDRWSQMTFLIYLDEEYEGGETSFYVQTESPLGSRTASLHGVRVAQGSVLCFFHGEHSLSPLHEGSEITRGVKHIVRSDVLYTFGKDNA